MREASVDLCPADTLGRRIWGHTFQCWLLVASQHTQGCGFPSTGSFFSSVFTSLWAAVRTGLEDVTQGRRGWGGWDPVWFIPMSHWRGAATPDRQTDRHAQPSPFPLCGHSSQKPGGEETDWAKSNCGDADLFLFVWFFVDLVVIKSQHKLQ